MDENSAQYHKSLLDMVHGFMRGKLLCTAVRLGIADALGEGKTTLLELATATSAKPDPLRRVLRALASIGVIEEIEPDRFSLTPLGRPLQRKTPQSVWASMVFWPDLIAEFWTYLPECLRAEDTTFAAPAMEKLGVKSRWSMETDAEALFHTVFAEPTANDMAPFVSAYDFSTCRVVADLGGADGALLSAILTANPQANGILVDRKQAIERAQSRLEAAGFAGRCQLIAGDLLEEIPQGADLYILKSVLHGYDDEPARRILQECRSVMTEETRFLLIEAVLPDTIRALDPQVEQMMMSDINMLAVTGGRERSKADWTALLSSADLKLQSIAPVTGSTSSIIQAAL